MDALSIILVVLSIAGAVGTFYFGLKSNQLFKQKKRFTWDDLQAGSRDLGRDIGKVFTPDLIFTLSCRGATIAHLVMFELGEHIPQYVGIQEDIRYNKFMFSPKDHETVNTTKWNNYIPKALLKENQKKLLIIDDFAMSGDSLKMIVEFLIRSGFNKHNIRTATMICTNTAIEGGKAPDFFWFKTPDASFYFPWGKAR